MKSIHALSALVLLVIVGVTADDEIDYKIPEGHPVNQRVKSSFPMTNVKGASVVNLTYVPKMSAVKDQTTCTGANGTMAAIAVMEYWAIKNNSNVKILSDQAIVDCAVNVSGCTGGHTYYSMNYAHTYGVPDGTKYKWTGKKGACANKTNPAVAKFGRICSANLQGDEKSLAAIITQYGPMVGMMALAGSDYASYKAGQVFTGATCKAKYLDTWLVIAGFGTDAALGDYWIVRMNRGPNWGDKGYFKVGRGKNVCGIGIVIYGPC